MQRLRLLTRKFTPIYTASYGLFNKRMISDNLINELSKITANHVFEKSCYSKIDFKINENNNVKEALARFTAFNVGCLAVVNNNDKLVGVVSERDYIKKVASLEKKNEDVFIKDICTYNPHIIIAQKNESINRCMQKMMFKDIRHLLILDNKKDDFIGMISIRDLIREVEKKNTEIITRLSDFNFGKGAYFGSE